MTTAPLRTGYTTGACAAAAAKAAALCLFHGQQADSVEIVFPDGTRDRLPVASVSREGCGATAMVRKDAGDDPDVTDGCSVVVTLEPCDGNRIAFAAGDGVGQVTLPGLQVPPGEPAINHGPRRMIEQALREVTAAGLRVVVSIPGGAALAARTFNPRLGVEGGLSILGTSGRVRPFSAPALRDALRCSLDVAAACGVRAPVLVPGHIGENAAHRFFRLASAQVIPVSNEWGFMLDAAATRGFIALLLLGHPGKLAKLAAGDWDTHSSRSGSAVQLVKALAAKAGLTLPLESPTVEGLFGSLDSESRQRLGRETAVAVLNAVRRRIAHPPTAAALVNMQGELLGSDGDLSAWEQLAV